MISPSSLDRRILCPGSERLESVAPPRREESPHAVRGNKLHACMAELCETGVCLDLERGYLDPDDDAAVRWCWEVVRETISDAKKLGHSILVEQQIDLSSVGLNVEGDPERCRLDLAIIAGDTAYLWDWKFGEMYSPRPKYSWQFKSYALGLVFDYGVKSVVCTRVQPAVSDEFRKVTDTFTDTELMEVAKKVSAVAVDCSKPDAPLVTGSKQCGFCSANTTCPARAGSVLGMPMHLGVRAYLESSEPKERADFYERLLVVLDWAGKAKAEVEAYIMDGNKVSGFGIGNGRGYREWLNETMAQVNLRDIALRCGKNPDGFIITKLASVSQVEKILGTSKPVKVLLEPLIQTKDGAKRVMRLEKQ